MSLVVLLVGECPFKMLREATRQRTSVAPRDKPISRSRKVRGSVHVKGRHDKESNPCIALQKLDDRPMLL